MMLVIVVPCHLHKFLSTEIHKSPHIHYMNHLKMYWTSYLKVLVQLDDFLISLKLLVLQDLPIVLEFLL